MRAMQRQPCSTTFWSVPEIMAFKFGIISLTVSKESMGMLRQQLAAVVTAVRWTLVEKKSRYMRHAVRPPSRTIEVGYSTDIFSSV